MRKTVSAVILGSVLVAPSAIADVAIDAHGSTLGFGAGITVGITEQINVRGLFNTFTYDFDDDASDIDYEFELELANYGGLVDWHPGGGGFRLSIGAFANNNEVNGVGVPASPTVQIGDVVFNTAEVGTLQADVEFDSVAPYAGIGWGNAVGDKQRWAFSLDVGVLFQGDPSATFRSVGANPLLQAQIDAEIATEEADIQNDLDSYDLYPVASFGVSYKF